MELEPRATCHDATGKPVNTHLCGSDVDFLKNLGLQDVFIFKYLLALLEILFIMLFKCLWHINHIFRLELCYYIYLRLILKLIELLFSNPVSATIDGLEM